MIRHWTDPRDGAEWEVWIVTRVPPEPDRTSTGTPAWVFFRCGKKRYSADTALGDWVVDELAGVQLQVLLDRARTEAVRRNLPHGPLGPTR